MGQGQSSGRQGEGDAPPKADFYELLGVSLYATNEEIKKAYRKKALELHPDRNFGNTDDATKLFAEVQTAYEILSNPQERAWYDSHRDEILHDGVDTQEAHYEFNVRMTTAEDITRMYMSFDGRSKFDDSANGFFTLLRDFFERLATEEVLTCERDGKVAPEYPSFGSSEDSFEDVVRPFYAAWSGFSTQKEFSWKDKYRLSDAPDRRTRRLMEKENKKAREQGIRDFNGAVRALVSFVKRRDPRQTSATQNKESLHDDLRAKAATQAAKARAAHQAKTEEYVVPSWAQSEETDEEFATDEGESGGEEVFECVVCSKTFKSESQYQAHEKSKKHRKAVYVIERTMRKENKALGLDAVSGQSTPQEILDNDDDDDDEAGSGAHELDTSAHQTGVAIDSSVVTENLPATERILVDVLESDRHPPSRDENESERDRDSYNDVSSGEEAADAQSDHLQPTTEVDALTAQLDAQSMGSNTAPKIGKAKQKKARKEAAKASGDSTTMEHHCMVCKAGFTSKNQLFKHIHETEHVGPPGASNAGKKKKR